MQIAWLVDVPLQQRNGSMYSASEAARLRVFLPATELAREGHTVTLSSFSEQNPDAITNALDNTPCDVLVIGGAYHHRLHEALELAQTRQIPCVIDVCMDWFTQPEAVTALDDLARQELTWTVPNERIATALNTRWGISSTVIASPVEGSWGFPKFAPALDRIKLLWAGHPGDLPALAQSLTEVVDLSQHTQCLLSIVCDVNEAVVDQLKALTVSLKDRLHIRLAGYSPESLVAELKSCDLVMVPSQPDETKDLHNSEQIIVEAIRAGRCPMIWPTPQRNRSGFEDGRIYADTLQASFDYATQNAGELVSSLVEAHKTIEAKNSISAVGQHWAKCLKTTSIVMPPKTLISEAGTVPG